jgi:hypothetical protein
MIDIQTGTMLVSFELSNSILMNWDVDYPNNKCKPPQDYKLEAVDTDQHRVVEREQLQDCGYLLNLVTSFEEKYIWLEVKSVWLIQKQKEGAGFQDWHIDLAKNGQTVYTISVNIGSLDLQAVSREINYLNVDNNAYAPDIDDNDEEAKQAYVGDSEGKEKQASVGGKEGVVKQAPVARSLKFSDDEDYIDIVEVDSDKEFWLSFPRDCNSRNFILGGPQKPDTMGITAAEKEATLKQYRKARESFTNKEPLSLMKSMSNKGIATSPQKRQLGNFKGDQNKMV